MALTKQLNSKVNMKQYSDADLPINPKQPAIARYAAESTSNQTVITLPFQIDTVNAADSFILTIDGKTMTPGASNDYQFSGVDSFGFTNTVTLNSAIPAGLNIQGIKLGLKKESEFLQDARFTAIYEGIDQGLQGFVRTSDLMTATTVAGTPSAGQFYSSISNRASIVDMTKDLKARMGIDRMPTQQLYQIQNEFGPNGEPVFGIVNDTIGMVRLVGAGWQQFSSVYGNHVQASTTSDYAEITFYGTGLNLATLVSGTRDVRVTVDGGTEGAATVVPASGSAVLDARNYLAFSIVNAVSGLSLGVHTVKLRLNSGANFPFHGFEVVNTASTVNVSAGASYVAGKKLTSIAQTSLAYNTTFESGTLGTRGGRVVVYQKADGSIAKAVQPVDATTLTLAAANHQNEEVARIYFPREFGAGRADDFSTLTTSQSARAFTLDDGTTTLVGSAVRLSAAFGGAESVYPNAANDIISFTFVGTGLDVILADTSATSGGTCTYSIDGGAPATFAATANTNFHLQKVVSGLPYGTHTFRYVATSGTAVTHAFKQFIVYQPKKPSIPTGSVEISDYNVLANYSANTTAAVDTIGSGLLRKMATREMSYVGTFSSTILTSSIGGWVVNTGTVSSYIQYTFFGTGFEFRFNSGTAPTLTVSVDGSTNLAAYTTSLYGPTGTFTAATGVAAITSAVANSGLTVSNIPLGLHTVKITYSNTGSVDMLGFDVITPIHSYDANVPYDQQNTLSLGSQSVMDTRKTSIIKDSNLQSKNISQAVGITSSPTTTSTAAIPMPDMSITHSSKTGRIKISYSAQISGNTINEQAKTQFYVNGASVGTEKSGTFYAGGAQLTICDSLVVNVPTGVNKIDLYWKTTGSATITASGILRNILVEEI